MELVKKSSILLLLCLISALAYGDDAPSRGLLQNITVDVDARVGQNILGSADLTMRWGDGRGVTQVPVDLRLGALIQRPLSATSSWAFSATGWGAGLTLYAWNDGFLAFDWESTSNPNFNLSMSGPKLTVGYSLARVFYRLGTSAITSDFLGAVANLPTTFPAAGSPGAFTFQNAFTYQHTFGGEIEWRPFAQTAVVIDGSFSLFGTSMTGINVVLPSSYFSSISGNRRLIQNFENWTTGISWAQELSRVFDTLVSFKYGAYVVGITSQWDLEAQLGIRFSPAIRLGAAYGYYNNTLGAESTARFELNVSQ